jgi:hypothetical protein
MNVDPRVLKHWSQLENIEDKVKNLLGIEKPTNAKLIATAESIGFKIDRAAKRNRKILLCWYAEHWEAIENAALVADSSIAFDLEITGPFQDDEADATFSWFH